jgi:hypothetical protein
MVVAGALYLRVDEPVAGMVLSASAGSRDDGLGSAAAGGGRAAG